MAFSGAQNTLRTSGGGEPIGACRCRDKPPNQDLRIPRARILSISFGRNFSDARLTVAALTFSSSATIDMACSHEILPPSCCATRYSSRTALEYFFRRFTRFKAALSGFFPWPPPSIPRHSPNDFCGPESLYFTHACTRGRNSSAGTSTVDEGSLFPLYRHRKLNLLLDREI